jgi:hypothetical protein
MSQNSSQLSPSMLTALVELAKQEIPAGQPLTFDTVEEAVVQLLRRLGPELMTATLLGESADPAHPGRGKRGHRRSAPAEK